MLQRNRGDKKGDDIVDRPLPRGKGEVSLSAFAFLFSELVQYAQSRSSSVADLEARLEACGRGVGVRCAELITHRERGHRRETRVLGALGLVQNQLWRSLFGRAADSLERSTANEDEYMVNDALPLVNRFVSVPRDFGALNCAAYVAGIVGGMLGSMGFPAEVSAHTVDMGAGATRTTILVKFSPEVMERERRLG